jgi:galactose PTS system EIIB component
MKAEGVFPMIKILAACGAGINSSHQIKTGIEEEMKKRGYDVQVDTMVMKDITEEILAKYDIFAPISKPKLPFEISIPVVEAGPILYRISQMADPVFEELESVIKSLKKR